MEDVIGDGLILEKKQHITYLRSARSDLQPWVEKHAYAVSLANPASGRIVQIRVAVAAEVQYQPEDMGEAVHERNQSSLGCGSGGEIVTGSLVAADRQEAAIREGDDCWRTNKEDHWRMRNGANPSNL